MLKHVPSGFFSLLRSTIAPAVSQTQPSMASPENATRLLSWMQNFGGVPGSVLSDYSADQVENCVPSSIDGHQGRSSCLPVWKASRSTMATTVVVGTPFPQRKLNPPPRLSFSWGDRCQFEHTEPAKQWTMNKSGPRPLSYLVMVGLPQTVWCSLNKSALHNIGPGLRVGKQRCGRTLTITASALDFNIHIPSKGFRLAPHILFTYVDLKARFYGTKTATFTGNHFFTATRFSRKPPFWRFWLSLQNSVVYLQANSMEHALKDLPSSTFYLLDLGNLRFDLFCPYKTFHLYPKGDAFGRSGLDSTPCSPLLMSVNQDATATKPAVLCG